MIWVKNKSTLHRINHTRSVPLRVATGGMLATLVVGGAVVATNHKNVTIDVNGKILKASTVTGDVRAVLDSENVDVSDGDLVTPGLGESLSDGSRVTVRSARQVALVVDGQSRTVDTTKMTVSELLDELGIDNSSTTASASAIPLSGMELSITSPKSFTLNDGQPDRTPARLTMSAPTVADVLSMRGAPLGKDDIVTPAANTPVTQGMHIDVTRLTTEDVTEEQQVAPTERVIEDPDMDEGTEEVIEAGRPRHRSHPQLQRCGDQPGRAQARGDHPGHRACRAPRYQTLCVGPRRRRRIRLGPARPVRGRRQLGHQHRQRLLRWPAVHSVHLGGLRWHRVRPTGTHGHP